MDVFILPETFYRIHVCPLQVIEFYNENHRNNFKQSLTKALADAGSTLECHEAKLKRIYAKALTQKKRNQYLEKFFKTVFSEASAYNYQKDIEPE